MEIIDVQKSPSQVGIKEKFQVLFKVVISKPFEFPFSNESLQEKKIEFVKEE